MGCGTSSAKPAPKPKPQQTVQKKTSQENTTSDQAEKVHVGTNGTGHTAVPASGSQINVQIDANGGTDSAAGAPAVTQDNLQGQGATAKSDSENRGSTDDKQGNDSPIGVRNQSIHNPRNTRQTARSGSNYLSRNDPSQNLTPRVKASPTRAYTAGGYPPSSKYVRNVHTAGQTAPVGSPRRNGRFQPASRAKSLPSRAEQALFDERMSDPAYRKKILVESSERLKAMEKNSPRQENDGEATVSEATNAEFKGTDVQNSTKHSAQNENNEANKGQTDKKMSERKADGKDATKSKGITTRNGEAKTGQSNQKTDKQKAGGAGVPNNPQQRQNAKGSGQNKIDDSPGKKTNPTALRGANRLTEGGKSPENVGSKQNPGEESTKSRHWKSQLDQPIIITTQWDKDGLLGKDGVTGSMMERVGSFISKNGVAVDTEMSRTSPDISIKSAYSVSSVRARNTSHSPTSDKSPSKSHSLELSMDDSRPGSKLSIVKEYTAGRNTSIGGQTDGPVQITVSLIEPTSPRKTPEQMMTTMALVRELTRDILHGAHRNEDELVDTGDNESEIDRSMVLVSSPPCTEFRQTSPGGMAVNVTLESEKTRDILINDDERTDMGDQNVDKSQTRDSSLVRSPNEPAAAAVLTEQILPDVIDGAEQVTSNKGYNSSVDTDISWAVTEEQTNGTENVSDDGGIKEILVDTEIRLSDSSQLDTASLKPEQPKLNSQKPTSPKRKRYNQQTTPRSDDPNERARSRRIRFMLREATKGNDVDELDEAIYLFESNELADNGDLTEALKRLELLQLRRDLRVAIIRRNRGVLTTAIDDTYVMKHDKALRQLLDRAEELRDHLQALDAHSHDILHMDQKLISEIRSYCKPPPSVHEIMAACYMLLGVPEDRLLEWGEVQSHVGRVGRGSLRNLIIDFNPDTVPVQTLLRVKEILNFYHLADVRIASNGAASFYLWAQNMVELIDKRRPESQADDSERVKSSAKKG